MYDALVQRSICIHGQSIGIDGDSGYLSSKNADNDIGTAICPWNITSQPGE